MRRIAPLILAAFLCQGCFVFDELDKGNDILDHHFSKKRREAQKEAEAARGKPGADDEEAGTLVALKDDLLERWRKFREPKAPERDPEDTVVRCELGGSVQFTRKSDCQIRGGKAT